MNTGPPVGAVDSPPADPGGSLPEPAKPGVTNASPPAAKIALFRSLFRGRDEVYPRRFESRRTGKSGYSPACANEWVRGVCEKPRVKCTDCPHRRFLPVTDAVISAHLLGHEPNGAEFVMGIYPMMQDETCFFLAADFDQDDWQVDVAAFLDTCRRHDVPAILERSRSGHGGHVWIFFDTAIPAGLARKLGAHLLTETMTSRPELGFRSYDRFFPNQDTLPSGGFGNLIALPLQKRARQQGNTLFLDGTFQPHADPWAFLATVRRMPRTAVETIVARAETKGRVLDIPLVVAEADRDQPWAMPPSRRRPDPPLVGPLPKSLELVLGDQIYISKDDLTPGLRHRLLKLAAFQNPEFYRAQSMRLPTHDKPRIIACAEDLPKHIALPRGCLDDALATLRALGIQVGIRDERFAGVPLQVEFQGVLRTEQQQAATALLAHDCGVLSATTAFGKTVVAAWLIARRGVNTLVLVHRQQLLEQWIERLASFLGVPAKSIGRLGGGRRKLTGTLDVALMQSLVRKEVVDDRIADYGHIVVDECHHLSARSFELAARRARARFVTGLSATLDRKDGHQPIIFMQCGPIRHRVDARSQAATRPFTHHVLVRPTNFRGLPTPSENARIEFHGLCEALRQDGPRNDLICADVVQAVRQGRSPLVLTERTEHLHELAGRLAPHVPHLVQLRGGQSRSVLTAAMKQLAEIPDAEGRVILAIGKYVGEGFDDPRLDTLFLALPVSWRGTIAQYVGRLHRLRDGKRAVEVYDYADLHVPMLARMFDRRCAGYEALGYTILLPGSALPGWPANVPLPVDPEWKRDYAGSVRRLVRDGVDTSLATLFVQAARSPVPGAEGEARARSAAEAFLYRRLESHPEAAGRFQLNRELPIIFDPNGTMEVDLVCERTRTVIELDGPQHFVDADAYRRDRRKDALLQRHGYLVLRFLSDDVSRRLDDVLDSILTALAHRERSHPKIEISP